MTEELTDDERKVLDVLKKAPFLLWTKAFILDEIADYISLDSPYKRPEPWGYRCGPAMDGLIAKGLVEESGEGWLALYGVTAEGRAAL